MMLDEAEALKQQGNDIKELLEQQMQLSSRFDKIEERTVGMDELVAKMVIVNARLEGSFG